MARDKLQRAVNSAFQAWVKELERDFDDACHDKISERDEIDRDMILRYVLRWALMEMSDYSPPEIMERRFADIFYQMSAGKYCTERFSKVMGEYIKSYYGE